MNIYLNRSRVAALLMMIHEAEGMISGSADGWFGLYEINPEFYEEIQNDIDDMKQRLEDNGYTFASMIEPILA